jgi:hypothetical protein
MRFSILGFAALLAACNSAAAPRLGEEFTLRVGQSAAITELNLWMRFNRVVDDSRCPANVSCVWEGDGAVVIEVAPLNGDSKEDTLHTTLDPRSIPLGRAELQLVKLEPYPATPDPIAPGDYIVTLATRALP